MAVLGLPGEAAVISCSPFPAARLLPQPRAPLRAPSGVRGWRRRRRLLGAGLKGAGSWGPSRSRPKLAPCVSAASGRSGRPGGLRKWVQRTAARPELSQWRKTPFSFVNTPLHQLLRRRKITVTAEPRTVWQMKVKKEAVEIEHTTGMPGHSEQLIVEEADN
ncbi:uncharacterized protein PRD47_002633 isoform 1-T1 [Ara ararauna]